MVHYLVGDLVICALILFLGCQYDSERASWTTAQNDMALSSAQTSWKGRMFILLILTVANIIFHRMLKFAEQQLQYSSKTHAGALVKRLGLS
jgi:hypothetical protein